MDQHELDRTLTSVAYGRAHGHGNGPWRGDAPVILWDSVDRKGTQQKTEREQKVGNEGKRFEMSTTTSADKEERGKEKGDERREMF